MEYKIGDLICSKRYKPTGIFDLGIVSDIRESKIKQQINLWETHIERVEQ
jgi:hypothetical protein